MSNRIVSLTAGGTEIIHALGLTDVLVGRSHACNVPEQIQSLPVCTRPQTEAGPDRGPLTIDDVNLDELNRLRPTHVIVQQGEESGEKSLTNLQQIVETQPQILSLNPVNLTEIWSNIQTIADTLEISDQGSQLVESLQARLETLRQEVIHHSSKPRVVCLEWLQPLRSAGNWVPDLVEIAGGVPLLAESGTPARQFEWSDLVQSNPDVIAMMPCGFDIPRTISELGVLFESPDWFELRAVRQGRVYLADGNQFFHRAGPRLVESAEILFEILHDAGRNRPTNRHHRSGWLRLEEC